MHIKRYEAPSMEAALEQIREELGPDALILSSRTLRKRPGVLGRLSRETVEVQAALERAASPSPSLSRPPVAETKDELASLLEEVRKELGSLRSERRARPEFEEELRSELRGLRQALGSVLGSGKDEAVDASVAKLLKRGLEWRHAESIAVEWRTEVVAGKQASLDAILEKRIEAALAPPRAAASPPMRVLVGAPGVGKTTTLAKLAARNDEGEGEVALISMDPYRIGAQDQLRRYASLLHSPFREVTRVSELREISAQHPGHQILVDTAGRGQQAEDRIESLEGLRDRLGRAVSIELVVDATARYEIQRAQLARFATLEPDRVILSKVDECQGLSDSLNLLLEPECPPLSWLANGQRVPEDLVMAEAGRFSREDWRRVA